MVRKTEEVKAFEAGRARAWSVLDALGPQGVGWFDTGMGEGARVVWLRDRQFAMAGVSQGTYFRRNHDVPTCMAPITRWLR